MERVRFCQHCGELLEDRWLHCPWCGEGRGKDQENWDTIVDVSIDKTEANSVKGKMGRLEELSGRLDALEIELDSFLADRVGK